MYYCSSKSFNSTFPRASNLDFQFSLQLRTAPRHSMLGGWLLFNMLNITPFSFSKGKAKVRKYKYKTCTRRAITHLWLLLKSHKENQDCAR